MVDKLLYIFIGYSICATLIIIILIKKPSITYKIAKSIQKTKRNKGSSVQNDITPTINTETRKKRRKQRKNGILKRIFIKRKKT
jgi:hypothetical protein